MLRRLALALALATSGLALASPAADADAAAAPVVGQCHELPSLAAVNALSDPRPAVPCSSPHNALTVAVVDSPVPLTGLADGPVTTLATRACFPAYWKALGGTPAQRHLSDFVLMLYAPTQAERDAGANWFRCDVGLMNGGGVAALPPLGTPVLPRHLPRSLQRCLNSKRFSLPCSRAHSFRATKAFRLPATLRSPDQVNRLAARRCRNVAWTAWDPSEAWALGDHWATCFVRTRH